MKKVNENKVLSYCQALKYMWNNKKKHQKSTYLITCHFFT